MCIRVDILVGLVTTASVQFIDLQPRSQVGDANDQVSCSMIRTKLHDQRSVLNLMSGLEA